MMRKEKYHFGVGWCSCHHVRPQRAPTLPVQSAPPQLSDQSPTQTESSSSVNSSIAKHNQQCPIPRRKTPPSLPRPTLRPGLTTSAESSRRKPANRLATNPTLMTYSKSKSEFYDPCQEAAQRSYRCLFRNGGDKNMCGEYFQYVGR